MRHDMHGLHDCHGGFSALDGLGLPRYCRDMKKSSV